MTKEEYASLDESRRKELEAEYGYLRKEKGWGDQELTTFLALLLTYRELRQKGLSKYITREDLALAYGSNSTGTASKFMGVIEKIEADQPPRNRAPDTSQANVSSPHSPSVQNAFESIRTALETASRAVLEARTAENEEISHRYQAILQEQQADAEVERQAYQVRVADLEKASSGAGAESWKNNEAAESLRAKLVGVEAERDAALARAHRADHGRELDQVQRASAQAQIDVLKAAAVNHSAEVSRLQGRCTALEGVAAEVPELRGENAALRERADALADQVGRQDVFILEMNRRHERELAAIRADYDSKLVEERRQSAAREARLVASFGFPGRREGERD
jgi:hypothetical protein